MNIIEKDYNWAHELSARQVTNLIILHHAAAKSCTAVDVHNWHLNRGWAGIGYHFFVGKDGSVTRGRPLWAVGAHAESCNWRSVGVCFGGDYQTETEMPAAQLQAGRELVQYLKAKLGVDRVVGHRDVAVAGTSCPGQHFPLDAICAADDTKTNTEEDIIMVATQMIGNGGTDGFIVTKNEEITYKQVWVGTPMQFGNDVKQNAENLFIVAPNGTLYTLSVDNNGNLSTKVFSQ